MVSPAFRVTRSIRVECATPLYHYVQDRLYQLNFRKEIGSPFLWVAFRSAANSIGVKQKYPPSFLRFLFAETKQSVCF